MNDDTLKKIGKILDAEDDMRDAVHVAVVPVTLSQAARPGQRVGLAEDGTASPNEKPEVGIVDPFLTQDTVPAGQRCYLFLFPAHDAFDRKNEYTAAQEWLGQVLFMGW